MASTSGWHVLGSDAQSEAPPAASAGAPVFEGRTAVTEDLLARLLPGKAPAKLASWCQVLRDQEIESIEDARELLDDQHKEDWNQLQLPAAIRATLHARFTAILTGKDRTQAYITNLVPPSTHLDPTASSQTTEDPPSQTVAPQPIQQLDCIVLDVSYSMKSSSAMDKLKTREDVSKLMFHTMIDRILSLEMNHAVSLVSFGVEVDMAKELTVEYEDFHDMMGRLDARQAGTKLYDAVAFAADSLVKYAAEHRAQLAPDCPLRVFALTDGEDNRSKSQAWAVAQKLQKAGVVLDALPLGPPNSTLQAMATATGGFCVHVADEQKGLALFESEKMLHVASREVSERQAKFPLASQQELEKLKDTSAVLDTIAPAVSSAVRKCKTVSRSQALSQSAPAAQAAQAAPSLRRVMREYRDIITTADPTFTVHLSENDPLLWKAVIQAPAASIYAGSYFVASLVFPADYPMKPPGFRFITPVYHCNVSNDGAVCLDALRNNWSPALTAAKVINLVQLLLEHPHADDPLDTWKAQLYNSERPRYESEAKRSAKEHAHPTWEQAAAANNITKD